MELRSLAITLVLAACMLAGCADNKSPVAVPDATSFEDVEVTVTDTTGAILGVVVDDAIRPIEGVVVKLQGAVDQPDGIVTDTTGRFSFGDLEPGTYFLQASRFGYFPVQASAEVEAGVEDPPIVRMQLVRDVTQKAYYTAQQFTGFIVCTSSVVALCGAPNVVSNVLLCPVFDICLGNVTDDRFGWDFFYEANSSYIQTEIVWKSTQPVSLELSFQMETIQGCDAEYYENTESGESPLANWAMAEEIAEAEIGGECSIFHSLFSGDTAGTPAGVTINQKYEAYSHSFYGYLPPEGWRFTADGDPPRPPE